MTELQTFSITPHLAFDALIAGAPGAPLVLLLHGFAESMHCWRAQIEALGDAGYRAIAPSQRGYSAGARPDTREKLASQGVDARSTTPDEFARILTADVARWAKVVQKLGLQAE